MGIEYKDVLRVDGVESTLSTATLRNKMVGFSDDDQHRMIHKNSDGEPDYWVPEGYDVTYGNITIGEYLYHDDNLTTYLRFTTNAFEIVADGHNYISTSSNGLVLNEQVTIGQYTFPYTGGQIGQILSITETGVAGWNNFGTTGMQITEEGATIIPVTNNRGSTLYRGDLVKAKCDTYPNGVTWCEEDCEDVAGVMYNTTINGAVGWMCVPPSYCYVKFDEFNTALKGELWGMANPYYLSNLGRAKCWTGMNMAHAMGYCAEDSGGGDDYGAMCYFNSIPHGVAGRDILNFDNDFATDNEISIEYVKTGNQIMVHFDDHIDYSTSDDIKFLSWPSKLTPREGQVSNAMAVPINFKRIGGTLTGGHVWWQYDSINGARFQIYDDGAIGWGATGLKGIYYPTQIMYHL